MITVDKLKSVHFFSTGEAGKYSRKIHDKIFIEYDAVDGFCTLIRFLEIPKRNIDRVKITLPKKVNDIRQLKTILGAFE